MAGVPIPRRDASFEFSESEQVSSRFQSLNGWLKDLTRYFRNVRTIEEMDLLIENELTKQVLSGTIKGLPFVQLVLTEQHRCLELMKNIRCFLLERLRFVYFKLFLDFIL